ncbi:hypothetical protein GALL_449840 [mine drainage metagenome]|uniref:Uncharacterized protein n=1 Tax=mine drainage metagenome TaxID=410659 RepID=A0A1J5QBP3_9ZZZZ
MQGAERSTETCGEAGIGRAQVQPFHRHRDAAFGKLAEAGDRGNPDGPNRRQRPQAIGFGVQHAGLACRKRLDKQPPVGRVRLPGGAKPARIQAAQSPSPSAFPLQGVRKDRSFIRGRHDVPRPTRRSKHAFLREYLSLR